MYTLRKYIQTYLTKQLTVHPNLTKISVNIIWLFLDKILRLGGGLVVGVWVAKYLGPANYGVMNYAIALVSLFMFLSTLGLDDLGVRELVKHPENKNEILGSTFVLKLLGGCFAYIILIILSITIKKDDNITQIVILISALGLILNSASTIDLWFKSQVNSKFIVLSQNIGFIISSFIRIVLILKQSSLLSFIIINIVQTIIAIVAMMIFFKKNNQNLIQWRYTYSVALNLLKKSWPLILSGLAITIYMKIDQIMLGELINKKAVGIYAAAVKLSEIWYFIPLTIASSFFPSLVRSKQLGDAMYNRRIQHFYDLNVILALVFSLPFTFFAKYIFAFLYGVNYAGADTIFAIHIWSCLFVFLGVARQQYLLNEGLIKYSFFTTVLGAIINVSLNFILIPKYEGVGAAWATLASYCLSAYISSFFYPKLYKTGIMQSKAILAPFRYLILFWRYIYVRKICYKNSTKSKT